MTIENKNTLHKKFASYVLPSVAAMWIYTIYTMVDGIFVARGVGKDALAAVNISMPMINIAFALGILCAVGASTRASIYKGRKEYDKADEVFTTSIITVAATGLIVVLIVLSNLTKVATLLGATDATMEYVKTYLHIIILFVPFYMTAYNLEVLVKADGFPLLAIKTGIASAVTNIVLDAVFVLVFKWGIAGAAIATGLSQVLTFTVYMIHFCSKRSGFSFIKIKYSPKLAASLAKLGVADFVTELSVGVCIFVFNRVLLQVAGNDGVVIYTVITYVSQLVLMTMSGINQGTQPLVSFYHGRRQGDYCKYIFRLSLICSGICSVIAFLIGIAGAHPIVEIYIDKLADPVLFAEGVRALRIYSFAFLPLGTVVIMMGYFTAVVHPKSAMSISICRGLAFPCLFVLVLSSFLDETGVWLASPVSECCALLLALILYMIQKKNLY